MKKQIISITALASVLLSGAALADPAKNDESQATLNFNGRVTASLCQVNTTDMEKNISLGELSLAELKASGKGPAKSFEVKLINCDTTLNTISYTIAGKNNQGQDKKYLVPVSNDTSAKGVGVWIQDNNGNAIEIGTEQQATVVKNKNDALSEQTIPLQAYIGTQTGDKDTSNAVQAGNVNATAVMTIRTAAAPSA
ncbi:fimbrial protein [Escherichia albertii]|nr:fimbrial protein [Escherichia albertii]